MKSKITKSIAIVFSFLMILALIITGCGQTKEKSETTSPAKPADTSRPLVGTSQMDTPPSILSASSAPSNPMQAKLSISEPPILGKPVQLTVTLTIHEKSPLAKLDKIDVNIDTILPEGFELVSGFSRGTVTVTRNSSVQFQNIVKSTKTGEYKIETDVYYKEQSTSDKITKFSIYLYCSISETGASVSDRVPMPTNPTIPGKPPIPPLEPSMIPKSQSNLPPSSPLSGLTVRGYAECPISVNTLPQQGSRADEQAPIVWGGVVLWAWRADWPVPSWQTVGWVKPTKLKTWFF